MEDFKTLKSQLPIGGLRLLAQQTGYSEKTVQEVLSGKFPMHRKSTQVILQAAKELAEVYAPIYGKTRTPAGLLDNDIEVFCNAGELFYTSSGKVFRISDLPEDIVEIIKKAINPEVDSLLKKLFGCKTEGETYACYLKCRLGNFDFSPDIKNGVLRYEAPVCSNIRDCPGFGKICKPPRGPGGEFTKTEYFVMQMLAKGFSPVEISAILYTETGTVRTHIQSLHKKLRVKTTAEVIRFAHEHRAV